MTRPKVWDGGSHRGNCAALSFDDPTVDDDAAPGCPCVPGDARTFMDAHVSVERDDVSVNRTVDVEIAPRLLLD